MDELDFVRALSLLFAFASAFAWGTVLVERLVFRKRARFARSDSFQQNRFVRMLRNGVRPCVPVAKALLRIAVVARFADGMLVHLEKRDMAGSRETVLSALVASTLTLFLVATLILKSPVCGAALAALFLAGVASRMRSEKERLRDSYREMIPDALRSMSVCFQVGLSLPQTMRQVAEEIKPPLAGVFLRCSNAFDVGRSAAEALEELRGKDSVPELAFVAVALDVQHQSGGSVVQVLEAARETVEGELELVRSLRVQTAQARFSARIVSVMPLVLVALFALISDDFLTPFFESALGMALLGIAVVMQVAGVMLVRRMLKVEVE